jgi:hypothetical protein
MNEESVLTVLNRFNRPVFLSLVVHKAMLVLPAVRSSLTHMVDGALTEVVPSQAKTTAKSIDQQHTWLDGLQSPLCMPS